MRRWNARIGALLLILILVHMVTGAFQLMGILKGGLPVRKALSLAMAALLLVHIILGIIMTKQSLIIRKTERLHYDKQNVRFWLVRISGVVMIFLVIFHIWFFAGNGSKVLRLRPFEGGALAAGLLLVLSLLFHILLNVRPMFTSLVIEKLRKFVKDTFFILLIVILVAAAGFVIYYLRWNVFWRE